MEVIRARKRVDPCDGNRRNSGGKDLSDGEKEDQARRSADPSTTTTTMAVTRSIQRGKDAAEVAKMRKNGRG